MSDRPLVLLTNDDGYRSAGLASMIEALSEWAEVVAVAPENEQSACSHSFTLHRGLRLTRVSPGLFALDGTPADCVYVALLSGDRILPRRPSLVVSGLNYGLNLGLDVYYSGTVAGAREAALRGVCGLACSADVGAELRASARACSRIAQALYQCIPNWSEPHVFNMNVPPGNSWPVHATRLGRRVYGEGVEFRLDPRGREYLWIGGTGVRNEGDQGTDTYAFEHGEIGVSSLPLMVAVEPAEGPAAEVVQQAIRIEIKKE